VYYEDSPELVRLKDEKAKIEAERMRLLQRATSKHPAAIKMSDEINQLQSQIEALTRLPQVIEDVVEKSNPELVSWKKELADVRAAVTGNMAKLIQLKAQIGTYIPQLAALEKQRLAREMTEKQKTLNQQMVALEAQNIDKTAQPEDPFRMFSPAGDAVVSDPPDMFMCILAGVGAGLICAYFLLLSRVKTNFKVLEKPEVVKPVYPVIGRISRLNDGEECA
jgi:chromosome segregation ATPase